MLAVLHSKLACAAPDELKNPDPSAKNSEDAMTNFVGTFPDSVTVKVGNDVSMAYSHCNQSFLKPRSFGAKDECFCVFVGTLANLASLRQQYGLTKSANEVMVVIEAYRTLRDRAPFPPSKMVAHLEGYFAFVVFDSRTSTAFAASDSEGKVELFWGSLGDGSLVFSDEEEALKHACGQSFAQFPPGCYFCSSAGLQSFKYPKQKVVAVAEDKDGATQRSGTRFRVVLDSAVPGAELGQFVSSQLLPGHLNPVESS